MQNTLAYFTGLQKQTRRNIQDLMDAYSLEQVNKIPAGFNNNLIWNYGHVVVTQQLLTYALSGLDVKIEKSLIDKYRKGTKPESLVDQEEYNLLQHFFDKLPDQTLADYEAGIFKNFNTYQTSFGVSLSSIMDGVNFNNMHEAMHLGNMQSIRKFL